MDYALRYTTALLLTVLIELGVARILRPRAWRRLLVDVPLVNLVSHPLLTLAVRHLHLPLPVGEVGVVVLEGLLYRSVTGLPARWAWTLSIVANFTSWFVGVLVLAGW